MLHHVHISACGRVAAGAPVITLAICGPRGGMRAIEDITIEEAEGMLDQLTRAIEAARTANDAGCLP
ncbi:hypothetical protein [Novosphingobium album (ex Liu et al. 2023)]|uniref:Uncharacterized protein n=1 Tax=Novosphingobium album (ex Liu et al. 2023) TaxID=3031130 RepID=A0ABT5WQ40_9SPHN|nr:hypothetical protein [Novosphingobium album (ex Liu et al. 2023)]MDE8652163.1 hypothetical protein [Novosphingobium album (ex Liu et al. 2023)]